MKNTLYTVSLIFLCLALSGWGSKGHKKISQNFAACLPEQMSQLKPTWTAFIGSHASDADYRKSSDPNESPRHYIDIDNYPEFILTGLISQEYDTVVFHHGEGFVIDQGTLPWATKIAFDSLKSCFQREDWNRSAYFAADLGHYVADGHMPLHITNNYNGQMTGQTGIHSRYETSLVSRYETQIVYPADQAQYVENVRDYIFDYLYLDYKYVDSLLLADTYATTLAGNTNSDAYYQALWAKTGDFTKLLMRNASTSLADLVYTAWVQAGSPMMYPNAIEEPGILWQAQLQKIFPNPAAQTICFPLVLNGNPQPVTLMIYDLKGNLVDTVLNREMSEGTHNIFWDVNRMAAGTYFCTLKSGGYSSTQRFVVLN